jgi:hypothetical protein
MQMAFSRIFAYAYLPEAQRMTVFPLIFQCADEILHWKDCALNQ